MKFRVLFDRDYGFALVSTSTIESDYPVYLVIRREYTEDWGDSPDYRYHYSILAVSPGFAESGSLEALKTIDMDRAAYDSLPIDGKLEVLIETGVYATLWQRGGNSKAKLESAARKECALINMLFGLYADKPQNAMGATGWDWMRGDITGSAFAS